MISIILSNREIHDGMHQMCTGNQHTRALRAGEPTARSNFSVMSPISHSPSLSSLANALAVSNSFGRCGRKKHLESEQNCLDCPRK